MSGSFWLEENISLCFFCLENKPNSCPNFGSTIKQVKLKYKNVFINKLVNIKLNLKIYTIIL